jgi:hypothetical protein
LNRSWSIGGDVSAEHYPAGLDPRTLQNILKQDGRDMQHGNRVAYKRQRSGQTLERSGITRNREMTRPAARSGSQLRQVHGQPLLQLPGPARSDQGWSRRPPTDVNEQAGTIGLRSGAGKRRSGGPRSIRGTDRRDENDAPPHRPAGLA